MNWIVYIYVFNFYMLNTFLGLSDKMTQGKTKAAIIWFHISIIVSVKLVTSDCHVLLVSNFLQDDIEI